MADGCALPVETRLHRQLLLAGYFFEACLCVAGIVRHDGNCWSCGEPWPFPRPSYEFSGRRTPMCRQGTSSNTNIRYFAPAGGFSGEDWLTAGREGVEQAATRSRRPNRTRRPLSMCRGAGTSGYVIFGAWGEAAMMDRWHGAFVGSAARQCGRDRKSAPPRGPVA